MAECEAGWKLVNNHATWFPHAQRGLYLQTVNAFLDRCIASSKTFFMVRDTHYSQDRWDHLWEVKVLIVVGIVSEFNRWYICERDMGKLFDGGAALQKMWPIGFPKIKAKKTNGIISVISFVVLGLCAIIIWIRFENKWDYLVVYYNIVVLQD